MCTSSSLLQLKHISYRLASAQSHSALRTLQRQKGSLVISKICALCAKIGKLNALTSAGRRSIIPLWRVPRDTVDGGLTLQLVARVTGESQRLSGLVKGLFRVLHTGGGGARVSTWLVLLSWKRQKYCHRPEPGKNLSWVALFLQWVQQLHSEEDL